MGVYDIIIQRLDVELYLKGILICYLISKMAAVTVANALCLEAKYVCFERHFFGEVIIKY
jgi:hypothetical protein